MTQLWLETPTAVQLLPAETTSIPIQDRGFTYGDGLFETVRVLNRQPLFLDRHLERLAQGLSVLNLLVPWSIADLTDRCGELIAANRMTDGILRLTITRGPGPRGFEPPAQPTPQLIIQTFSTAQPPTPSPQPLAAVLAPWKIDPASPWLQFKSLSALDKVLAQQYARQRNVDEALFLNLDGQLTESTSSNLFIVRDDQVLTPARGCGLLPGVTRQIVIELAPASGYRIIETELSPALLASAPEAFLTNVARGVQPLVAFNGQPIGNGQPGPITQTLSQRYDQHCNQLASNPQPLSPNPRFPTMKQLIINADDYGRTAAISKGIRHAHLNGVVTTTTTMMNFPTAQADLQLAMQECPTLGLGVHLTLTAGSPVLPAARVPTLVNAQGQFLKLGQLSEAYPKFDPAELKAEWRAQIEKFLAAGAVLDHFDSHHHTSYFTEFGLRIMLDLADEYGVSVRRPRALDDTSDRYAFTERVLAEKQTPCPDQSVGTFYDQGVTLANLLDILNSLPDGLTEIMSHPGYVDEEILRDSSYNRQREEELRLLTDPQVKQAIAAQGIHCTTFRTALGPPAV